MPVRTQCPACQKVYTLADQVVGKKVRCTACQSSFDVRPLRTAEVSPKAPSAVRAGRPIEKVRRRVEDEDGDDFDEEEDRPRKKRGRRKEQEANALPWILAGVGGAVALLIVVIVVILVSRKTPGVANPPVAAAPVNPALPPPPPPQPVAPLPPGQAAPPAAPVDNDGNVAAGFYAEMPGEEIAPADAGLPDTVLRPRADDTIYRISNARIGAPSRVGFGPPRGNQALLIDYEVVRRGKFDGANVVIYGGDGHRSNATLFSIGQQDRGTIELTTGFGPFGGNFPKNAELYLTRTDARYKKPFVMKVSNSTTMGAMAFGTKARNWTRQEIDEYLKGPPNYNNPNAHPGVGQDTAWVGTHGAGVGERFVEPDGHFLGLEYHVGDWQNEKVFHWLKPILSREQSMPFRDKTVVARDGYAVSGIEVRADKDLINAFKLTFQKVKAGGSLDPADSYTSEWFGSPPPGGKGTVLGNDGRRVLGIHLHRLGAHISGIALVQEKG